MKLQIYSLFVTFLLCFLTGIKGQSIRNEGDISDISGFFSEKRGFNLLGKFDNSWSNNGFKETEFKLIHDLGFNFVRLPLDYRTYTQYGDWDKFLETELIEIDKAVEWGIKYDVHVCINLHRAPGYCVNQTALPANQQLNLWADSIARAAFVNHWKMISLRYKDVAPQYLSFNLLNEPSNVEEQVYAEIMKRAIEVIHDITPDRVIFVDGMNYARDIVLMLKDEPNVAQALHAYDPFQLTHYKASWVEGSSSWPVPYWPMLWMNNYLYGPWKSEYRSPLVLKGNFSAGTEVTVNIRQVSAEATLRIKAGTDIIYSKKFVCGPDLGDDFTQIVETQWGYQNISNKDYSVTLNSQAEILVFENASGDWMTVNSITLKQGEASYTYNLSDNSWGRKQSTYLVDESGEITNPDGSSVLPFNDYRGNFELANEYNIPVMIQEFGVHNQTPHNTAVAFLKDLSHLLYEYNLGWALWNLSGSFGILNSNRTDCNYELYQNNKLDREMLNALSSPLTVTPEIRGSNRQIIVYPSPAGSQLFVNTPAFEGELKIEIRDATGRIIKKEKMTSVASGTAELDVSDLKNGTYILKAVAGRTSYSEKFMILK